MTISGQFTFLMCKKCFKHYVRETTEIFCKRWNNYKNNARKLLRGESCMKQHLLRHFQSPRFHRGYMYDIY